MPEGPSLVILREQADKFTGRTVREVGGNSRAGIERKKHYQVHTRTDCPRCGRKLEYHAKLGKKQRRAFACGHCQKRYG